jgi:hypothetical protein
VTLRSFITDILVEFSIKPRTYHSEDIKVKSIYGWLKPESTPKLWAESIINGTSPDFYTNSDEFIDAIKAQYEDPNLLDILAIKLLNLRQHTSVLTLFREFENLITQLGYSKEVWGPMFYFKLKEDIKNSIAVSEVNHRDYTALRKVAITIDNRAE